MYLAWYKQILNLTFCLIVPLDVLRLLKQVLRLLEQHILFQPSSYLVPKSKIRH